MSIVRGSLSLDPFRIPMVTYFGLKAAATIKRVLRVSDRTATLPTTTYTRPIWLSASVEAPQIISFRLYLHKFSLKL